MDLSSRAIWAGNAAASGLKAFSFATGEPQAAADLLRFTRMRH
jgi:hypothetical protein